MCRRGPFDGAVEGTDKNGRQFWLLQTEPGQTFERPHHDRVAAPEAAPLGQRHRAYTEALSHLILSQPHRRALLQRGLTEADLASFKTFTREDRKSVARRVADLFSAFFQAVPGFYVTESGTPMLGGSEGLWIACRDLEGQVQGLRVRADNLGENGNRYSWLSSKAKAGPGSGAPASWWPAEGADGSTVRLTEGELKAAVAARKTGVSTISGGAGVSSLAGLQVEEWLSELGPTTVLLAPDSDAWTNPDVNRAVRSVVGRLKALAEVQGFELLVEVWDHSAKGVDDALQAGLEVRRVSPGDYLAALPQWPESVSASTTEPKAKPTKAKAKAKADTGEKPEKKRSDEPTQVEKLLDLVSEYKLLQDAGQYYASFLTPNGDGSFRRETHRLSRNGVRAHLIYTYLALHGQPPSNEALSSVLSALEARAMFEGEEAQVFIRSGQHEGRYYYDLCDGKGNVVEISAAGWRITNDPPCYFLRNKGMAAMPQPIPGGSLEKFKALLGLSEGAWILVVSWLVFSLTAAGPFPILLLEGAAGYGKSTLIRILKSLVDPSVHPPRGKPEDEEALVMQAFNTWLLVLDNLVQLAESISNLLCIIATGGSFSRRQLYTNDEESVLSFRRPAILSGVVGVVVKPDLGDRVIKPALPPLSSQKRRRESEVLAEFDALRPEVMGCLFDAVAAGLRNEGKVELPPLPRLADFAAFIVQAEEALPWPKGAFLTAFTEHRQEQVECALEGDPVAHSVRTLVAMNGTFRASPSELRDRLVKLVTKDESIPSVRLLGNRLRVLQPYLAQVGVEVREGREKTRFIELRRTGDLHLEEAPELSTTSSSDPEKPDGKGICDTTMSSTIISNIVDIDVKQTFEGWL